MGSRQKYRKLIVVNGERVTAKNSLAGMLCISDYRTDATSRVLVFEKPDKTDLLPGSESSKGLTTRQRKKRAATNGVDDSTNKSLAFPGESVTSA